MEWLVRQKKKERLRGREIVDVQAVFLILLKIHDYKTKKRIANVLLLSWAAVSYHNDISLTFVASSPTNIACMVGCNINTKKSVSFDRKQRLGLASHAY